MCKAEQRKATYGELLGERTKPPGQHKNKLRMHFIVIAHGLRVCGSNTAHSEKSEKNVELQYVCQELVLIILTQKQREMSSTATTAAMAASSSMPKEIQ